MARSETPTRVLLKKIERTTTSDARRAGGDEIELADLDVAQLIGISTMPRSSSWTLAPMMICDTPSITKHRPSVAMNRVICGD